MYLRQAPITESLPSAASLEWPLINAPALDHTTPAPPTFAKSSIVLGGFHLGSRGLAPCSRTVSGGQLFPPHSDLFLTNTTGQDRHTGLTRFDNTLQTLNLHCRALQPFVRRQPATLCIVNQTKSLPKAGLRTHDPCQAKPGDGKGVVSLCSHE